MKSNADVSFLLVGVGGQGTLLASHVVAQVGVRAGFDVKKAEVHGMAQRGGSVSSHVRWGKEVRSPLIGRAEADYLIAFEKLEALRYVVMIRPGGIAIVGDMRIPPLSVSSGSDVYPGDEDVWRILGEVAADVHPVSSIHLAEEAGSTRAHNVVVLGLLSALIPDVPPDTWLKVVEERVPERFIEVNRRAFEAGRQAGLSR
jgi:indolepyruvate ferredoxin oxidoreductase beta subunit